jgi:hypothetical protein
MLKILNILTHHSPINVIIPTAASFTRFTADWRALAIAARGLGARVLTIRARDNTLIPIEQLDDLDIQEPMNAGIRARAVMAEAHHQRNLENLRNRGYDVVRPQVSLFLHFMFCYIILSVILLHRVKN